jgi:hypothetical protein
MVPLGESSSPSGIFFKVETSTVEPKSLIQARLGAVVAIVAVGSQGVDAGYARCYAIRDDSL